MMRDSFGYLASFFKASSLASPYRGGENGHVKG